MAKVLIMIGSTTDEPVMEQCKKYLEWFGIETTMEVASAHRNPEKVEKLAGNAFKEGYSCIIAGAGMAAALPGVVAAKSQLPVLGVPLEGGLPGGIDALYSIVQMPPGVPVGTLGVGKAGARNAAILAARIIALSDTTVRKKLNDFKQRGYKL